MVPHNSEVEVPHVVLKVLDGGGIDGHLLAHTRVGGLHFVLKLLVQRDKLVQRPLHLHLAQREHAWSEARRIEYSADILADDRAIFGDFLSQGAGLMYAHPGLINGRIYHCTVAQSGLPYSHGVLECLGAGWVHCECN